jgi:hypothetical protein
MGLRGGIKLSPPSLSSNKSSPIYRPLPCTFLYMAFQGPKETSPEDANRNICRNGKHLTLNAAYSLKPELDIKLHVLKIRKKRIRMVNFYRKTIH